MLARVLRRRYSRTALSRKNAIYLVWRYIGNARRTWQALFTKLEYTEAKQHGRELSEKGILCGPSTNYLSESGVPALAQASRLILGAAKYATKNEKGWAPTEGEGKNYLIELVPGDSIHQADSPLLRVALDTKLLEIVASY